MSCGNEIHIAADLHLSENFPNRTKLFVEFLAKTKNARALFFLGDFFDTWIGDDDNSDFAHCIRNLLKKHTSEGIPIFLQHGNRDFMLGMRFANETGITLLPELYVLESGDKRFLLSHGDLFIDDDEYLRFRRFIQNSVVKAVYYLFPLLIRKTIAQKMRAKSKGKKKKATLDISRAIQSMKQNNCETLIHGHLHQLGDEEHEKEGEMFRFVCVPDWIARGGYLSLEAGTLKWKEFGRHDRI